MHFSGLEPRPPSASFSSTSSLISKVLPNVRKMSMFSGSSGESSHARKTSVFSSSGDSQFLKVEQHQHTLKRPEMTRHLSLYESGNNSGESNLLKVENKRPQMMRHLSESAGEYSGILPNSIRKLSVFSGSGEGSGSQFLKVEQPSFKKPQMMRNLSESDEDSQNVERHFSWQWHTEPFRYLKFVTTKS